MSQNAEILRRAIEHINQTGGPDWDLYDPELVWTMRPDTPAQGIHHGHDGLREGIESLRGVWNQMLMEIVEVIDVGDAVVVVLREHLRANSGVALELTEGWATWFRDGKLVRIEQHRNKEDALNAAGLSKAGLSE
jgi:ketosteroid isomerase-like protein